MSRKSYASPLPNTFAPTTTTTAAAAAAASANFAGYDVNQIHQYRSQLAINGQDANVSDVNTSVRSSFKPVASTRRESLLNPTLEVVHHHQRPKSTSNNQAASPPPILTNRTTSIQPRMVTSDAHSRPVSHPASLDKSNGEITNSVYILPMSPGSEINRSTGDTGLFWNELGVASNASQHHQHHQQQRHLTGTPQTTIVNHTVNYNASDTISIASSSMNHQNDNDDDDDLGSFIDVNRCWLNDEGKSATYSSNIPNYSSIGSNSLVYRPNSISSRKTIVPSLAQISLSALDSDNESMFSGSAWSGFSRDTSSNATSSIISASNRRATHHSLRNMMTETILNEETIDESGEYTVNVLPDQVSYHNQQDGISASHSYEHEQRVTNQHQHNHASMQRDHRNSNVPVNYPSMDRLTISTNGMNESSLSSPASSTILDYEKSKRISHTQSVSYQMMQPNNTISDYGDRDLSGISSLYSAESSPKASNNDKYDFSFLDQSFITNDSALSKTPDLSRSTTRSSRATNPDSVNDSFNTSTETYKDDTVKPKTIKESRTEAIAALVRCVQKHIHEFSSLRNEFEYPLRSVADMENMSIFQAFIRDRHNYIFGGVRKLAIFHKFFIEDLTNAVEKFKKNGTLKDIAKAFIAHMPGFRYYLHYIHEYSNVITTLEHLQSQYNPFKKTLAESVSNAIRYYGSYACLLQKPREYSKLVPAQ
ncbi:hypothetical protein BDF22DRAFT_485 [Syncephalis plumigaleata]|nr:hypothetical protein BDF22DRAFT_485 [Syncephalis plumigaleata]